MVGLIKRGVKAMLGTSMCARIISRLESTADTRTNLLRVLTYHRVDWPEAAAELYPGTLSATPDEFRWQMEYLSDRYHFVDIHAVLAAIRREHELPARSLLITFDDAYSDFVNHAWPTLREHELPAVLFVPTAFPDNQELAFWWDRLQQTAHKSGELATAAGRRGFRDLVRRAKSLPHSQTLALVDDYCESRGARPETDHILSWDQLQQLTDEGLDLAAHTRTHPLLTRVDPEEAIRQAVLSREDLRERIGIGLPVFSYPGGAHSDDIAQSLGESGFELAFTTRRGINDLATANPLLLRRINVSVATSRALVRAQLLAGMRHFDPFFGKAEFSRPQHPRAQRR
jgi:peptidoglycan/xylan/chitin deacetylase (PgdA/CDA1 family)